MIVEANKPLNKFVEVEGTLNENLALMRHYKKVYLFIYSFIYYFFKIIKWPKQMNIRGTQYENVVRYFTDVIFKVKLFEFHEIT